MKHFRTFIIIFLLTTLSAIKLNAQTFLPTSWDCTSGTLPTGWTTNIVSYYTSSSYIHSAPTAIKFDATGIYLTINFTDEPDTLKYYLRGASFSGGTFSVQQSVNGSTWNTIRTFTDANIPNSSLASATTFKDTLSKTSRFVRFYYTAKSGGNVAVDDILIKKRPAGPEAAMKVKWNNQFIPSGGTLVMGNNASIQLKIINMGMDSLLRIKSGSSITGTNASMFTLNGIPLLVNANDSSELTLNFSPTGVDGTKVASINLVNNDADNNPYIINIWAVKGCCATEPTTIAQNLNFSYVKSYKFRVNFNNGSNPPENYLMLKKASPITEEPQDGTHYVKGDFIGDAQVAYIGAAGWFYPSNVVANTHYYIKIFSFNGQPGYENYLTSQVAQDDTTTFENMIGSYYLGIDESSPTFWGQLHKLVNTHNNLYYSDYADKLIKEYESRDTSIVGVSQKVLDCAYSGEKYVYTEPFAFTTFSREHVFCESWMPTYNDANYTSLPEYTDYHNLLPVNQNKVNVYRLNYPLGKVVTTQYQYLLAKKGLDSLNHIVFEPSDNIKGDVARAMFYQILCYDSVSGNDWFLPVIIDNTSINYGQSETLLKKWNLQDPPDNYEIARNDYIYSVQANRNPFIDHPEWVNWFGFGVNSAVNEFAQDNISIFPNPVSSVLTIHNAKDAQILLYDIYGNILLNQQCNTNEFQLNFDDVSQGNYIVKTVLNNSIFVKKIAVVR